jgi:peroxiredoxin
MDDKHRQESERAEFDARVRAAWEEVDRYWNDREPGGENEANDPQHQLAPEFFGIYLVDRSSPVAIRALATAFEMWSNLEGASDTVEHKLAEISADQRGLAVVADSVRASFRRDQGEIGGEERFTRWLNSIPSLETRSRILLSRMRSWNWHGESAKVREACAQIIDWNASDDLVGRARAHIYDLDNLNVGNVAPPFSRLDLSGSVVDLQHLRGRVVLLDFWATWCMPCRGEFPHLRHVAEVFTDRPFSLVSISLDEDVEKARRMIETERLAWTHISDGGWETELAKLYHVTAIPSTFLLDKEGRINARNVRGAQLEPSIATLLGSDDGP